MRLFGAVCLRFSHRQVPAGSLWLKDISGIGTWVLMMVAVKPMAGEGFFDMKFGMVAPIITLVLHVPPPATIGEGILSTGAQPRSLESPWKSKGIRETSSLSVSVPETWARFSIEGIRCAFEPAGLMVGYRQASLLQATALLLDGTRFFRSPHLGPPASYYFSGESGALGVGEIGAPESFPFFSEDLGPVATITMPSRK